MALFQITHWNTSMLTILSVSLVCNSRRHAFTGCDYTPAFSGRGKTRPLKILQQCEDIQQAFISLGKTDEINDESVILLERFVCKMYGNSKRLSNVDEARLKQFYLAYKPKRNKPILSVKSINSFSMPP